MIGMVLVTHGRLAAEFLAALEHVVGKQQKVATVCIGAEDDMEQRRKEILETVAKVDQGKGVVLLTDMFGGTPSNLAISVLDWTIAATVLFVDFDAYVPADDEIELL